ncbi:acetyltransferase, GNAT family [Paenibacillus sp. oral taxon 786 str. D14]|uniref:GNAT family N-acetyltransferase n=1 Tax=Paenibacillus sp. oral taxon 786 TaxID=652715 RepID=UPI0001AFCB97|nr:GNAT family protein [Paenibacillus sp. oral taxon 786]EES74958.1 acetyltransferase, GNAT family [Paenibacillus sp. oral taxon 786 str. D14]
MIEIREIRVDDTERFLKLCLQLDQETKFMLYEPGERTTTAEEQRERIQSILSEVGSTILVAEDQGQLVGYLAVFGGQAKRTKHVGYIVVGITQAYSGKGIGTRLFQAAEAWRAQTELTKFELTVMIPNERAVALYKKMGFEVEGVKRNSIRVDGNYVDEYYMGKIFEA